MESKRTECVFFHVTPEVKKEIEMYDDDDKMKEEIIRQYITNEKDWLNESLEEFDKSEIIYKCSLVKIKDSFKKAQEEYADDISKLYDMAYVKNKQLKEELEKPEKTINELNEKVNGIKDVLESLRIENTMQRLESFISLIERFNNLSSDNKSLIKSLLIKDKNYGK